MSQKAPFAPYADNPSNGLIPLSISNLCYQRLNGWATIITHLIRYLNVVVDQEKKLAESLVKTSSELSTALNGHQLNLFADGESVKNLLLDMTDLQAKRANQRASSAANIEDQLIPILKELLTSIKKKASDPDLKWSTLDKELSHAIETYTRLADHVRFSLLRQNWNSDPNDFPDIPKDVPKDPWVANLALQKHIAHCFKKQKEYRDRIIEQQDDMAAFEAVIIQNIKVSMATFYEWRTGKFNQELDQIKTIQTQLTAMDPEQDWKVFKDNHANRFLENVPLVQIKELRYEGWDHPGLQIVKQGKLLRKEGVFKRAYKTSLGILTRSGYLHSVPELQPDEQFYELPEQTIDLMDCTLVPLMMNEKEPEEIALNGKGSGMFGRDVKHKFRGVTMADSAEWWGAISQEMKRHEGERNLPVANVQKEDGNEINPQVNVKPGGNGKPTLPTNQTNTKVVGNEIPPPTNPIKTTNTKPPPPKRDPPSQQPIPVLPVEPEPQPIPISSFATFDPPPIASLSITEQMERRMATATTASPPPVMDIPQFDAPSHNPPPAKSNPWDTFEADNGGW